MSHGDLERELRALGTEPPFPPTPDLAAAVRVRVTTRPAAVRRAPRWRGLPLAAQAAAVLLALLVALMAFSPGVRSAVLEALGLQGARIERREPSPRAREAGTRLDLGTPVTLAVARDRAPFDVVVPGDPGEPAAVFFDAAAPGGGQVAFVWERQGGRPLLLTQIAALDAPVVGKAAGPRTRIEPVDVGGRPGFWLTGDPHEFSFLSPDGNFQVDRLRLAGDTLLWNRRDVLLRLEGAPSKARALEIAASAG